MRSPASTSSLFAFLAASSPLVSYAQAASSIPAPTLAPPSPSPLTSASPPWLAPFLPAANVLLAELYDTLNTTFTPSDHAATNNDPADNEAEGASKETESEEGGGEEEATTDSKARLILDLKLLKRQSCAKSYFPCAAAGYCCAANTVCQTDALGQVACCPQGAACTGTVPSSSGTATATAASTVVGQTTSATTVAAASVGTDGGAIVAGGSTVAFIAGTSGAERRLLGGIGVWIAGLVGASIGGLMVVL